MYTHIVLCKKPEGWEVGKSCGSEAEANEFAVFVRKNIDKGTTTITEALVVSADQIARWVKATA